MPLKGTLAGCGYFANFQMEAWNRLPDLVTITAVCDVDKRKAEEFSAKYGVPAVYQDLSEMLDREKPDFLDIVTRPEQHLGMAAEAASRGIHTLCQKPFAPTIGKAEQIISLFNNSRPRLMVNENFRFQAWYREIKKLLDSGAIGEPFSFRWIHRANDGWTERPYANQPYFKDYPRLLIYETLVHWLDTSRMLFGEPSRVSCEISSVNPHIRGEDLAIVLLRYPGRLRGVIDGNRVSPNEEPYESLTRDAMGSLRIDGVNGTLWMHSSGRMEIEPRGGARSEHSWNIPSVGYRGDCCRATQEHFARCLLSGEHFESNGSDYLKTMRLVEQCYQSASEGLS